MALGLNAEKGTYVASTWKDGTDDYTPITPDKLNHIEQGVQANSSDIKTIGNAISNLVETKTIGTGAWAYKIGSLVIVVVDWQNHGQVAAGKASGLGTLPSGWHSTTKAAHGVALLQNANEGKGYAGQIYVSGNGNLNIQNMMNNGTIDCTYGILVYTV